MMALCSISEDKAAQEGNQLDKKSFDRDQNWWEDPLQSGSQPEGGREFNVTFWKVLRSSERFRLSRTESKVAFYIYVSWPLGVIMGQVKSTWPSSFTGNTGSWRGTQPLVSPSIKITWWPDDHQTLHTMIHGVQGQMFRGAKLSLKQTRTWLLGGNIVENQPETDQFDLHCKNEIGKFTWTRHAGWRRSRWRAWGRSSAWRTAGCPRPSVEVDKELI